MNIHQHYNQLTDWERQFVDRIFDGKHLYEIANEMGIPLSRTDPIERAIDAFAKCVIESRRNWREPGLVA